MIHLKSYENVHFSMQSDYPSGKSCSWYITVNRGHIIQLEFESFELDQDVTSSDFVAIYTGEKRAKDGHHTTAFKKLGTTREDGNIPGIGSCEGEGANEHGSECVSEVRFDRSK